MSKEITSDLVKICFKYYSNILDEEVKENKWALPLEGEQHLYELKSIAHYGAPVSPGDIIRAEVNKEGVLHYLETVKHSGNSTIQIVLMSDKLTLAEIQEHVKEYECRSEKVNDQYIVVEVPLDVAYGPFKEFLEDLEGKGDISYAEPWLSPDHQDF